ATSAPGNPSWTATGCRLPSIAKTKVGNLPLDGSAAGRSGSGLPLSPCITPVFRKSLISALCKMRLAARLGARSAGLFATRDGFEKVGGGDVVGFFLVRATPHRIQERLTEEFESRWLCHGGRRREVRLVE